MSYSDNPFSLKNKRILISGASSGIGRATAIECSKIGASVIIIGRNIERLNGVFAELHGEGHLKYCLDINNEQDVIAMVESIPVIDGLVNNIGTNKRMLSKFITEKSVSDIIKTNFICPAILTKHLLKKKKIADSSSIVFISSIASDRPSLGNAAYSASKGAVESFSKILALELAPKGIRVNTIRPGMVWTPFLDSSSISKEQFVENEKSYPLARYGKPEDIAYATIFLLSDASSWITGSMLTIDGGISIL